MTINRPHMKQEKREQYIPKEIKVPPKTIEQSITSINYLQGLPVATPISTPISLNKSNLPIANAYILPETKVNPPKMNEKEENMQTKLQKAISLIHKFKKNETQKAKPQKAIPQEKKIQKAISLMLELQNKTHESSIMTKSDFMKKYEITESQIEQVKLLLSNAFTA